MFNLGTDFIVNMKVKDFKLLLDSLDPEAHLFINETFNTPFRKTKATVKIPSGFCTVGKLTKEGNIAKNSPIERCAYIQIENFSSNEAVSGLH